MLDRNSEISALIVAGGSGSRMKNEIKKQFITIGDVDILSLSVQKFQDSGLFNEIRIVVPEGEKEILQKKNPSWFLTSGGERRQDSVRKGLLDLNNKDTKYVFIHDGVRPFVSVNFLKRMAEEVRNNEFVVAAVRVKDTIKMADEFENIVQTVERDKLWSVQTPQAFLYKKILEAHLHWFEKEPERSFTDDSMMLEEIGELVSLLEAEEHNIKITTPFDLEIAKLIYKMKK